MEEKELEHLITSAIKIGTIETLSGLGLLPEKINKQSAQKIYGRRMIEDWRKKGWITGYPTGNCKRGTVYFKRSEIERASLMMDVHNAVTKNRITKMIELKS